VFRFEYIKKASEILICDKGRTKKGVEDIMNILRKGIKLIQEHLIDNF
jgi:hypothetical protein